MLQRRYKPYSPARQIHLPTATIQSLTLNRKLTLNIIPQLTKRTKINCLSNSFAYFFLCWTLKFKTWLLLLKSTGIIRESRATLLYCRHGWFLLWPSADFTVSFSLQISHKYFLLLRHWISSENIVPMWHRVCWNQTTSLFACFKKTQIELLEGKNISTQIILRHYLSFTISRRFTVWQTTMLDLLWQKT